jgi:predicted transcriptional regulator
MSQKKEIKEPKKTKTRSFPSKIEVRKGTKRVGYIDNLTKRLKKIDRELDNIWLNLRSASRRRLKMYRNIIENIPEELKYLTDISPKMPKKYQRMIQN